MVIQGARVVLPDAISEETSVLIRAGRIEAIGPDPSVSSEEDWIDAGGFYLTPGFVDLHMHLGSLGLSPERELEECANNLPRSATTRYCATLTSALKGDVPRFFEALRAFLRNGLPGARPVGAHLEGPFIARAAAGGFDPSFITTPQDFDLSEILDAGSDLIRIVTLSPELPGTERLVRELVRRRIVAGLGHSMAGLEEYSRARSAGATHCCHAYNNRRTFPDSPLGGRSFTLDDLAVADDGVTCELICDGEHVKPVWIKTIYRTKGPDRICLVTDSFVAGKRIVEGEFQAAGGRRILVREGVCRNDDGGLCGSVCTLDRGVRVFMEASGASLPEAVRCASLNPARVIGIDNRLGSIEAGKIADLVLLDEQLMPVLTLVEGEVVFDERNKA